MLNAKPIRKIFHGPRVIWNMQDIVLDKFGLAVQSKTGHAFIKQTMRTHEANLRLIRETLEAAGIEFIGEPGEGPGVRLWTKQN